MLLLVLIIIGGFYGKTPWWVMHEKEPHNFYCTRKALPPILTSFFNLSDLATISLLISIEQRYRYSWFFSLLSLLLLLLFPLHFSPNPPPTIHPFPVYNPFYVGISALNPFLKSQYHHLIQIHHYQYAMQRLHIEIIRALCVKASDLCHPLPLALSKPTY